MLVPGVVIVPDVVGILSLSVSGHVVVLRSIGALCISGSGVSRLGLVDVRSRNGPHPLSTFILSTVQLSLLPGIRLLPAQVVD